MAKIARRRDTRIVIRNRELIICATVGRPARVGAHSERDKLRLGDVIVAEYIDFSGYWKYKIVDLAPKTRGAVTHSRGPD